MNGEPLFLLQAQRNPRIGNVLRTLMLAGALIAAVVAGLLPRFGVEGPALPYIQFTMLGMAAFEVLLAFVLPAVIEKQSAAVEYRFHADRLEMTMQGRGPFTLPYENIEKVEEIAVGDDSGLCNLRLTTRKPHGIPYFGFGTTLMLSSLAQAESPGARVKEVVEKSRAS